MLLSVIVPVYRVERYLSRCIESILNQTFYDFELLLINDGSPDRCPVICDEFAGKDARVKVIHKQNEGQGIARNCALEIARGQYVAFVDSDDWIEAAMFETMIKSCEDLECQIARTSVVREYESDHNIAYEINDERILPKDSAMELILTEKFGSQLWYNLYHKDLFDGIRFPPGVYEDAACIYKVFYQAKRVAILKDAFYHYTIRENSSMLSLNPLKSYNGFCAFSERLQFAQKNYPNLTDKCRALAAEFALGTYNDSFKFDNPLLAQAAIVVKQFLTENKQDILKSNHFSRRTKLLLYLFFYSPKLYNYILQHVLERRGFGRVD